MPRSGFIDGGRSEHGPTFLHQHTTAFSIRYLSPGASLLATLGGSGLTRAEFGESAARGVNSVNRAEATPDVPVYRDILMDSRRRE